MAAEGAPRFRCPEEFCARRFAPGTAFSPEVLPGRQLLLIRAPADFSPESLDGRLVPLLAGARADGRLEPFALQRSSEGPGSGARLLLPSGRPGRLACAPPFGACLSLRQSRGEPGADRPLLPVADRPPPRAPQGLRQRFFPFGGRPPAAQEPPRKRSRNRRRPAAAGGGPGGSLLAEAAGPRGEAESPGGRNSGQKKSAARQECRSSGEQEQQPVAAERGRAKKRRPEKAVAPAACAGSPGEEESLGSDSGELGRQLPNCPRKKKDKAAEEPLQDQVAERQQQQGASPEQRPRKQKRRRLQREDPAGCSAAET